MGQRAGSSGAIPQRLDKISGESTVSAYVNQKKNGSGSAGVSREFV